MRHELAPDKQWARAFARVEEMTGGRIVAAERQDRWRPAFFLEVERAGERLPIYFRGDRGLGDPGVYPLEHEYRVLQVLEAQGIPVPHVYGFCEDPRGIVMARAPGRANLATARDEEERAAVLADYMDILAQMHAIGPAVFEDAGLRRPKDARELGLADLPLWEKSYRQRKRRPEPVIEFTLRWLKRSVPAHRTRPCFLAGDSGQFVFEGGRVTAVLDLELAYLGDPLADLAGMRSRDLSEPLGDLSAAFRRYAERTGEEIDLPVLHYHTARFAVVTPLAVANFVAEPPPGFNYAQYLGWYLVYGRAGLEAIAEREGYRLEEPSLPEANPGRFAPGFAALECLLERGGDPEKRGYDFDTAYRVAQYLREVERRGPATLADDLDDVASVLGRRPRDAAQADAELEELVLRAGPERDAELVALLYRRLRRHEALLRPALRELQDVALQRIAL